MNLLDGLKWGNSFIWCGKTPNGVIPRREAIKENPPAPPTQHFSATD
jgi:hypothetical protein